MCDIFFHLCSSLVIDLEWDHAERQLLIAMGGHIREALTEFGHDAPRGPTCGPRTHTAPEHWGAAQCAPIADDTPLTAEQTRHIQSISGGSLGVARAVEDTVMHALNKIATATFSVVLLHLSDFEVDLFSTSYYIY